MGEEVCRARHPYGAVYRVDHKGVCPYCLIRPRVRRKQEVEPEERPGYVREPADYTLSFGVRVNRGHRVTPHPSSTGDPETWEQRMYMSAGVVPYCMYGTSDED